MTISSETPVEARGTRLPSLTGMRWWAALAVFVLHAVVFLPIYPFYGSEGYWTLAKAVPMQVGAAGVTFFFVLSGFVMWWTRRKKDTEVSFMWRRIKKIYPTHIVAAVLLMLVIPVPVGRLDTWLPAMALIQTWWPNWTSLGGLNVPAWSLASEMLFYLTFPFLAPLVARIKDRFVPAAMAILFAVIVAMHTAVYLWAPGDKSTENLFGARIPWPVPTTTEEYGYNASPEFFARDYVGYNDLGYWFSYYFPLMRLPEFFIGVLMCRLVLMGRFRNQRMLWPLVALAGAFAATWFVPINYKMSVLILLPTAAVIATAANRDVAGRRGANATRPMVWFGDISYAFYLIQYPVMVMVVKYLAAGRSGDVWDWLGYAVLSLLLAIGAAALIYHFIDKPITSRKKRPPAPIAPAVPPDVPEYAGRHRKEESIVTSFSRILRRPALAIMTALVGATTVTAVAAPAEAAPRGSIVVMGDSFTSDVFVAHDPCAQDAGNWPSQLGRRTGSKIVNVSCLGGELAGNPNVYDQAQKARQRGGFSKRTRAVLIQLGFNDYNGGIKLYQRCLTIGCPGGEGQFRKFTGARFARELQALVTYTKHYAPNARIALVGYPELYAPNARDICARIAGLPTVLPNTSAAPAFAKRLQKAQESAAQRLGVDFVNLQAATRGHGLCAADPWAQAVLTPPPSDFSRLVMIGHPTVRGNTAAAAAIAQTLKL